MCGKPAYERKKVLKKPSGAAAVLLLAGLLLALAPCWAQTQELPFAVGEIYEVREDINCNPGDSSAPDCSEAEAGSRGFGSRIADATLRGRLTGGLEGEVTIEASSILSRVDWTGPAHGKIMVASPSGTIHVVFSGQLNLSLAMMGTLPTPLAPISGHWRGTKGTLNAGGRFSGVFLVPFRIPNAPPEWGWFYLDLDDDGRPRRDEQGNPVVNPLQEHEYLPGGLPLVKLRVRFDNN